MDKTLVTKEHLEELGFTPCCRFWILESKDLVGTITYTEEVTPTHELGENSLDVKCYYCIKLHNKKQQEVRFFTEKLYVEDIMSMFEMLKIY
jgi:hypothetical protein